jgi:hypothetical protein
MSARINLGPYDAATVLHKPTTAAITASAEGKVGTTAKVVDCGDAVSAMEAKAIVEVAAVSSGTGAKSVITIQASDDNFAADIVTLAALELGDGASLPGDVDQGAGRYELPFTNVHNGAVKRYIRSYATITVTSPVSSLSYIAYLVPR